MTFTYKKHLFFYLIAFHSDESFNACCFRYGILYLLIVCHVIHDYRTKVSLSPKFFHAIHVGNLVDKEVIFLFHDRRGEFVVRTM